MNDRPAIPPPLDSPIAFGTVGWADGEPVDLGDSTNDGVSLIPVTLFRGKDHTKELDASVAQGQEVLCQLSTHIVAIPANGTRVLVAIPEPFGRIPGAAVIIATLGNTTWPSLGNANQGDVVIPCPGGVARIVMRKNGTIILSTKDSAANEVLLKISPTELRFISPWATIVADANGIRLKHASGAQARLGGITLPSPLSSLSSIAKLQAAIVKLDASIVQEGPDIPGSVFQPAVYGPDPSPTSPLSAFFTALETWANAVTTYIEIAGTVAAGGVNAKVDPTGALAATQTPALFTAITAAEAPVTGMLTSNCVKMAQ